MISIQITHYSWIKRSSALLLLQHLILLDRDLLVFHNCEQNFAIELTLRRRDDLGLSLTSMVPERKSLRSIKHSYLIE